MTYFRRKSKGVIYVLPSPSYYIYLLPPKKLLARLSDSRESGIPPLLPNLRKETPVSVISHTPSGTREGMTLLFDVAAPSGKGRPNSTRECEEKRRLFLLCFPQIFVLTLASVPPLLYIPITTCQLLHCWSICSSVCKSCPCPAPRREENWGGNSMLCYTKWTANDFCIKDDYWQRARGSQAEN